MGSTITNQDRNAVKTIFRKIKKQTDLKLLSILPSMPPQHPDVHKVMAAQNAMADCFVTISNECVPYGEYYLMEMGARMAAYAITSAPIEVQERLMKDMLALIPVIVEQKLAQGAIIQTRWTDGEGQGDYPGVPDKTDVN